MRLDKLKTRIAKLEKLLMSDKRLTIEYRVRKLERTFERQLAAKNEFLGIINKPKRSDEREWLSKMFIKYSSLKRELSTNLNTVDHSTDDMPFHLVLTSRDESNDGMKFEISTENERDDMFCVAYDKNGAEIARLDHFHLDKEMNQCAKFILQCLQNSRHSNEGKLHKYENVPLTTFDCESIKQIIEDDLDDIPEIEVEVTDDNADYGFINVGVYNPDYLTSYDLIVSDTKSIEVQHEDNKIGNFKSIEDAADALANHFMKDYMGGKYKKKK